MRLSKATRHPIRHPAIPNTISIGERDLLTRCITAEDSDGDDFDQLTQFTPGGWWLGSDQLHATTCWRLIRHALISPSGEESGGVQYWTVNETGRHVASDPTYVPPMIRMARAERGPFVE